MYEPDKIFVSPETKPLEPWRQDLLAAAECVRARGLCKGVLATGRGAVCAIGAIHVAVAGSPYRIEKPSIGDVRDNDPSVAIWQRRMAALQGLVNYLGHNDVPYWNDSPQRTADDVIRALIAAATESP